MRLYQIIQNLTCSDNNYDDDGIVLFTHALDVTSAHTNSIILKVSSKHGVNNIISVVALDHRVRKLIKLSTWTSLSVPHVQAVLAGVVPRAWEQVSKERADGTSIHGVDCDTEESLYSHKIASSWCHEGLSSHWDIPELTWIQLRGEGGQKN